MATKADTLAPDAPGRSRTLRDGAERLFERARRLRSGAARALGRRGALLFVALLAMNAGNLAFHVLASQLLGPGRYGALGSLLAILVALAVPFGALQVALTGEVARAHEAGRPVRAGALAVRLVLVGLVASAVLASLAPVVRDYLHLQSVWPVLFIAAYLVPMSVGVVPWACLCGHRRFGTVAAAVVAAATTRIGVGAVLLGAGAGVAEAALATLAGEVVLACALLAGARRWLGGGRAGALWIGGREALAGVGALAGLAVLVGLDTVLARHHLDAADAGRYAAAAMLARGALFLCQAATTAAVPILASARPDRADAALRQTLVLAGALGLLATATLTLSAGSLLPAIFGAGFDAEPALMLLLGLASTGAGLLSVLIQRDIARRKGGAAGAWAGVAVLPVLIALVHSGPVAVAGACVAAVAVALAVALAADRRRRRAAPRPAMALPGLSVGHEVDLTVVVPFHNPGRALRPNLERLLEVLEEARVSYEVITVDDGCTDGSGATIADLDGLRLRRLRLDRNQGKGEALRAGLRLGRGRYLGFIDSDGDIDPRLWGPYLELMRAHRPDAVVGSKRHPASVYEMRRVRRLCSLGYQRLARILFRLPVHDTQVGIKLFRRELLIDALPRTVERGFVFDLELLAVARRMGYRRLMEAPVLLSRGELSTIRVSTVWTMLVQTAAVAWRMHVLGRYGSRAHERPAAEPAGLPAPVRVPAPAPFTVPGVAVPVAASARVVPPAAPLLPSASGRLTAPVTGAVA
jgi:O-antigen/teichoic acid export membrane protein